VTSTQVAALQSSPEQIAALQIAEIDSQFNSEKAIDSTGAGTSAETSSTTGQRTSASSSVAKSSDKSYIAIADPSGTDHVGSANLASAPPASSGSSGTSQLAGRASGPPSAQGMQSAQQMADRVAETLRTAFQSGGELRVRLEPPALGKVQIEVQANSGVVSARLEVQTPAARQTLLDNISMLHDAIGQTGATVNRIDVEVVPQRAPDSNGSDQRHANSGGQQSDSGANSQDQSNTSGGGQQKKQSWRRTTAIDEIDIEI
jgi:flagellar hook-length control protein FliK